MIKELYGRYIFHPLLENAMQRTMPERERLLRDIAGDVLELGIGAGTNLPFYQGKVRSLVGVEPDALLADECQKRAQALSLPTTVLRCSASKEMPLPEAAFDSVVITFVLCSVDDVAGVLHQARRHLRPNGKLYLLEHIEATGLKRRVQHTLRPLWKKAFGNCDPCVSLPQKLSEAGFSTGNLSFPTLTLPWPISSGAEGKLHL